jgi:uncharacterized repeat protein (TIGR01451 family)
MRRTLIVSAALSLAALGAEAKVVATQIVEKEVVVVDEKGVKKTARAKADLVKPGETVVYTLNYKNEDAAPAQNMILVMPVPKEVVYVEGSVTGAPATVTFSADGGETYVARGRLTVTEKGVARPATNGDITHVKWTLAGPVAPNGRGEVSFRGVLK